MDNKMLISMMGSTAPSRDGASSTSKAGGVDADAFSQALEKATGGNRLGAQQSENLISEKQSAKAEAERRQDDAARNQTQASDPKLTDPKTMGSRAYLYQMMYKNPDAMSLAEKQALKMDAGTRDGVGLRELQRMMSERGLNMRELSFTQMANLTRTNSRAQVSSFLEHLSKEQKGDKEVSPLRGSTSAEAGMAASSSANKTDSGTSTENGLAAAAVRQAGQTTPGRENAQTQKRREVIDQIVQHMELRNLANRDELHLKLNPEYLGELKIKLVQGEGGVVSARFSTTSQDTREVLQESRSDLRKRVEERGIRLGQIEVDLVDELA